MKDSNDINFPSIKNYLKERQIENKISTFNKVDNSEIIDTKSTEKIMESEPNDIVDIDKSNKIIILEWEKPTKRKKL